MEKCVERSCETRKDYSQVLSLQKRDICLNYNKGRKEGTQPEILVDRLSLQIR